MEKGKGLPENRVKAITQNVRPFTPCISILTARRVPSRRQFVGVVSEETVQEKGPSETDIESLYEMVTSHLIRDAHVEI